MKKRTIKAVLLLLAMTVAAIASYPFFKKTYLESELIYSFPNSTATGGHEYVFFHTKESIDHSNYLTSVRFGNDFDHIQSRPSLSDQLVLDFDRYSYCVYFGRKAGRMYHSYKSTFFDDKSDSQFRCWRIEGTCVFDEGVSKEDVDGGTHIYRLERNTDLRGFYIHG